MSKNNQKINILKGKMANNTIRSHRLKDSKGENVQMINYKGHKIP